VVADPQILEHGSTWISGCANHDTLRRGTQVSPELTSTPARGHRAADPRQGLRQPGHQDADLLRVPGRADGLPQRLDAGGLGVHPQPGRPLRRQGRLSEEAISLVWQVDEEFYPLAANFKRLKALGFETLEELRRFMDLLPALVEVTDYDLDTIATLINGVEPPLAGAAADGPGRAEDGRPGVDGRHARLRNVTAGRPARPEADQLQPRGAEFRRARPVAARRPAAGDAFDYLRPVDGHAVFASLRHRPDGASRCCSSPTWRAGRRPRPHRDSTCRARPRRVAPGAADTPNIGSDYLGGPITLNDSSGVVFTRER
jgi:hypothetical protein